MPSSKVIWSDHQTFLLHGIRHLWITGEGSDFHIKCGAREFAVHKMVLNLFTDYFQDTDGLWLRIEMNPVILEKILTFLYYGQVNIQYDEMETFLRSCRLLQIRLFQEESSLNPLSSSSSSPSASPASSSVLHPMALTKVPQATQPTEPAQPAESTELYERYELSDFQLVCRSCYKVFPDDKAMKKHKWGCGRKATFACRFCHRAFKHKFVLTDHERRHTGEKPHACTACPLTFSLKSSLTNHFEAKHMNVQFPCPECDYVLNSKSALKNHLRIKHAKERPFSCQQCGACFAFRCDLTAHVKLKHANFLKTKTVPERDPATILKPAERQYHGQKLIQSKGFWKMYIGPLRVKCFFCQHVMLRQSLGRHFKQVHPDEKVTKPMLTELDQRLKTMALERKRAQAQGGLGLPGEDLKTTNSPEIFTHVDDIVSLINRLY
ncbi:zinc finger protein 160-like [Tigriopus californicus]|uniref:zinc finger protein 160-like n=1 Tax=Tigriopus californicus TaxID=6832 RepID=UPI0027DA6459|nr:zinc finger protein 160-like [Tigriopus californicus]